MGLRFFLPSILLLSTTAIGTVEGYKKQLKNLDISALTLKDICTGMPAFIRLSKIKTAEIWSQHCGNCLWKIEDNKNAQRTVLINVDENPQEACAWLKKNNVFIPAYHDPSQQIERFMKGDLPLPSTLTFDADKVKNVEIGYWRATSR